MDIKKILINALKALKIIEVYTSTLFARIYMFLFGYSVGRNFRIGINSWIYGKNVKIGNNVVIGNNVRLYVENITIDDYVVIRDGVTVTGIKDFIVNEYCSIHENVRIEGDKSIAIGENVWIGRWTLINVRSEVNIGNNTAIGEGCMLWTHGHWWEEMEGYPVKFGNIIIEGDNYIGPRVIIFPGVKIGKNAMVAMGSVVTHNIPPKTLNVCSPKKMSIPEKYYKKTLESSEKISMLINYLFLKVKDRYDINKLDENIWEFKRGNYSFLIAILKEVKPENVSLIVKRYKTLSEFLFISQISVPSDTKDYVKKLKNITIFDLQNKTYRKANTGCEALLKRSVYDRVARFVKEEY